MAALSIAFLSLCCHAAVAQHSASTKGVAIRPQQFSLPDDFYPESVAVDKQGTFYISSFRQGAVARLRPGETQASIFIASGSNGLTSAQGLWIDEKHNTLWSCSGDFGYSTAAANPSALKSFDLTTGSPKASYPLPQGGYCNDIAVDRLGNLYVTDSVHPRILRLRNQAGALEVWAQGEDFAAGASGLTLNGIAFDTDGSMYVSKVDAESYLLKISVKASGAFGAVRRIGFPRTLHRVDALRSIGPGRLALFENDVGGSQSQISVAHIARGQGQLQNLPATDGAQQPSSGVVYQGRLYYAESQFSSLLAYKPENLDSLPKGLPFRVLSVPLVPRR